MKEKGRFLKKYRGNTCLNCDVPLDIADRFCHQCGQSNTTKKLSLKDFFNEFFASIISYDSRLRHTINALLFRPGKISKDYIEGKRMRYANPFRFYLSISFIFFIVTGFFSDYNDSIIGFKNGMKDASEEKPIINIQIDNDTKEHTSDNSNLATELTPLQLEQENDTIKDTTTSYKDIYFTEQELSQLSFFDNLIKRGKLYSKYIEESGITKPTQGLDSLQHEKTSYHKWVYNKSVQSQDIEGNLAGVIMYFLSKLPFIIFFLLPIFALTIWALYYRRNFTYMEHLVFLFHTQTMFFIVLLIGFLLDTIFMKHINSDPFTGISMLIFLFYLYKAMRKFYQQGRFKTIVKFMVLNQIFAILAVITLSLGFIVSFALY